MRASAVLQKVLDDSECVGHRRRQKALVDMTDSLLRDGRVSVTGLGRGLRCNTSEKHAIKRADALLRNTALQDERVAIYKSLAERVLCGITEAVVSVDWSDSGRRDVRLLRAAVAVSGRALTLYEEVHEESVYNSDGTHRAFLKTLSEVVPEGIKLTIVTDAGFRAPWFRAVSSHGWYWVGRVRSCSKFQRLKDGDWESVQSLHALAGQRARSLGTCRLNKNRPLEVDVFVSSRPKPKRKGPRRHAEHYRSAQSHREPWVIVCSPALQLSTSQAMKVYATRMQIEQSFRDLKNPQHGLGMRFGNSRKHARVAILMMIAALATFVLWLVGLVAESQDWTRKYQANTVRKRRVLSFVFVGLRVLRRRTDKLTMALMNEALQNLKQLVVNRSLAAES